MYENAKDQTYIYIAITATVFLSLIFSSDSEAIRIVQMDPSDGAEDYSYGGYIYHAGYVRTTEGLGFVKWYVNGKYATSSYVNNGVTEAYFSPYWLEGNLQGIDYTITAVAYSLNDEDGDDNPDTDSRSYQLKVWEPVLVPLHSDHTDTSGYVEITKLYYDPNGSGYAVCDGYFVLTNLSDVESFNFDLGGRIECFATNIAQVLAPDRKVEKEGTLGPGETFSRAISLDMNLGIRGASNGIQYTMEANYWMNVSVGAHQVDDVEAVDSHTFEYEDQ